MNNWFTQMLTFIANMNEGFFAPIDGLIHNLPFEHWILHAIIDSIHMLPFLFFIFVVVELTEYFFSEKIEKFIEKTNKLGPLLGSLIAVFPQCGFSVIASTLYVKKMITTGTLIAAYVATSDEAIPILLSTPEKAGAILPLLALKIIIALIFGYLIDLISRVIKKKEVTKDIEFEENKGCCSHCVTRPRKRDLIYHPLEHTLNVFIFVLIVSFGIGFLIHSAGGDENLAQKFLGGSFWQIISASIFGLIPNCAASVGITLLYIKDALSFGATVAGLCSSAGLGLIILARKNDSKLDTLRIISLLVLISVISGTLLQIFNIK